MTLDEKITFRVDDDQMAGLEILAEELGVKVSEVVRLCLPTPAQASFFVDIRHLAPSLTWEHVVNVGVGNYLLELNTRCAKAHYKRLGIEWGQDTGPNVEAAVKRCLDELAKAEIYPPQYEKACNDIVYLGRLCEAFKFAKAQERGFAIRKTRRAAAYEKPAMTYITIYKDGKII